MNPNNAIIKYNQFLANQISSDIATRDPVLAEKDSGFWRCIEKVKDVFSGYVYVFEGHQLSEKAHQGTIEKIYPAIEIVPGSRLLANINSPNFLLYLLGYQYLTVKTNDHFYLILPDREALLLRWKYQRKINAKLPEINVISSSGIATAKEFIDANLQEKSIGILSTNREFVHDSTYHLWSNVLRTLGAIENQSLEKLENTKTTFTEWTKQAIDGAQKSLTEDEMQVFMTTLSYCIDSSSTLASFEEYRDYLEVFMRNPKAYFDKIMKSSYVDRFFKREIANYSPQRVIETWDHVISLTKI